MGGSRPRPGGAFGSVLPFLPLRLRLRQRPTPPHPVAPQDLAMYINEVKRDKETLKKISEFQSSIENLVGAAGAPGLGRREGF